jgi:hypothetical protein
MTCSHRAASARLQLSAAVATFLWVTRARLMASQDTALSSRLALIRCQQLPVGHTDCRVGSPSRRSTFVAWPRRSASIRKAALVRRPRQPGKTPCAIGIEARSVLSSGLKSPHCWIIDPPTDAIAAMAATNKCLAQSNKTRTVRERLRSSQIRQPGWIYR